MAGIPQNFIQGDSYFFICPVVSDPQDEDWDSFVLTFSNAAGDRAFGDVFSFGTSGGVQEVEILVEREVTRAMALGEWRFTLVSSNYLTTKTQLSGLVFVNDPLVPPSETENQEMLTILKSLIKDKVQQRGDIREYHIGDRETRTMSLDEIQRYIDHYQELVNREQFPLRLRF